jgi:hypothetical protein
LNIGIDVTGDGIKINSDRVESLNSLPVPKSTKDVKRVLGAFNFVRKWIPRFSSITKPLHKLTAKGTKFSWRQEHQRSFDQLKEAAATATNMTLPQTDDPLQSYVVIVDASKLGYGLPYLRYKMARGRS